MKFSGRLLAIAVAAMSACAGQALAQDKTVKILHWWTSGGEAAAIGTLKKLIEEKGYKWEDIAVASSGGAEAMTALRAQVTAGNAPTAAQLLGPDTFDWAAFGVLADLNRQAADEGWDKVVPEQIRKFAQYEGKWVATPIDVHSTNWVWFNKPLMDKIGGSEPKTYDEFIALLEKAKAAGVQAFALGGQPWQEGLLFENVVLATQGRDFYEAAFLKRDPEALASPKLAASFKEFGRLKPFVDANFSGRTWNEASAMVIEGKALVQHMGDWAKGEFTNASKAAGTDYECFRFPGTQEDVVFNSDVFAQFALPQDRQEAQKAFASVAMSAEGQKQFNILKGSVPVRTDVGDEGFDACAKKAMAELKGSAKNNTLIPSFTLSGLPAAYKGALYDVASRYFHGELAEDAAAQQLIADFANAQ